MKYYKNRKIMLLIVTSLFLICTTVVVSIHTCAATKTEYYDSQIQAAQQLAACFHAVKEYKQRVGITINEEDYHQTGMIGESYTEITTTLGSPEAKRTTAWPDMAALCVRLLYEAGIRPGDVVGANFSGSFPGMNLAVVVACECMDVELVCIASVGASSYGANNPEITFPEMMVRLEQDGLIKSHVAAVTAGGSKDIGADIEPQILAEIRQRLAKLGVTLIEIPDFADNIRWREDIYQQLGPIDCFVSVGGNVTSLGCDENSYSLGQGILSANSIPTLNEKSGLIQRYQVSGIPVINLLNIKKLVADYNLAYDPTEWPALGESSVYWKTYYPKEPLGMCLFCVCVILLICGRIRHCSPLATTIHIRKA